MFGAGMCALRKKSGTLQKKGDALQKTGTWNHKQDPLLLPPLLKFSLFHLNAHKLLVHATRITWFYREKSISVADLGGRPGAPPPAEQTFFNFRKCINILARRLPRGWRPLLRQVLDPPLHGNERAPFVKNTDDVPTPTKRAHPRVQGKKLQSE